MTGLNSNKHYYLACSGIELYGIAKGKCVAEIPENDKFEKCSLLCIETKSKIDEKDLKKAFDGTSYKFHVGSLLQIGKSSSLDYYLLNKIARVPNIFVPFFQNDALEEKLSLRSEFIKLVEEMFSFLPRAQECEDNECFADAQAVTDWLSLLCDLDTEFDVVSENENLMLPFAIRLVNYIENSEVPGGVSFSDCLKLLTEECERICMSHSGIERFWNWIKLQGIDSHFEWNLPPAEDSSFYKVFIYLFII